MTVSTQVQARLCEALKLFIQTVNPPYPQSMALWQEHLKAATENAKAALTAAAEVGDEENEMAGIAEEYGLDPARDYLNEQLVVATIERCAREAKWFSNVEKFTAEDVAARILALKEKGD